MVFSDILEDIYLSRQMILVKKSLYCQMIFPNKPGGVRRPTLPSHCGESHSNWSLLSNL